MNFVRGSQHGGNIGESVTWHNNPIYQSPERSGTSWYDQATHWEPSVEGVESISQSRTNNPVPHWANREQTLSNLRSEWDKSSTQAAQNGAITTSQIPQNAASGGRSTTLATPSEVVAQNNAKASKVNTGLAAATTAGQTAIGGAALAGAPLSTMAMVNAALGAGTAGLLNSNFQGKITEDFTTNSNKQGTQSGNQARIIREMQTGQLSSASAGAQFGGLFGPVGALLGWLGGNTNYGSTADGLYDKLKTGYTFGGRFNPQDTGSVNTASSAGLTGESNMTSSI